MKTTVLNIKVEPEVKKDIQAFAKELGVSVSAILNSQMRQILRDRKVELSTELRPTDNFAILLSRIESDISGNKNISKRQSGKSAIDELSRL